MDFATDTPAGEHFERPYFGLHRVDWVDTSATFTLGYGDWIQVSRTTGFVIDDPIEIQPPAGATTKFPASRHGDERCWQ